MKSALFVIFMLTSFLLNGQVITTVVSTGVDEIQCMAIDHYGNLFVTTYGNQIKRIDSNYIVTIIAGTGSAGFSGDGDSAIHAKLHNPLGIIIDSSENLFFADNVNNRIRKIDLNTGIITTIAGDSTYGGPGSFSGDGGLATHATLFYPQGVCIDNVGNLYFSDSRNYRIRKIDVSGIITTYAGNGLSGSFGDGSPATAAECWPTEGMVIDNAGNLFFTQEIVYPTIRKVSADGIISTIAGDTASHVYNGDGIPATSAYMNAQYLAFSQNGLLYLCDEAANSRVRFIDSAGIIHTVVGNGIDANTGDGGPATAAEIAGPSGITFDGCGNLFISDFDGNTVRKVTYDTTGFPNINISSSLGEAICVGTSVTFTSTVSAGAPVSYNWYIDGAPAGAIGSTYTYAPANGDSIRCVLIGIGRCSGDTVTVSSNTINMVVTPLTTPTITITGSPAATVGNTVTVNATVVGAGSSYNINWYNNSILFNTTTMPYVTYTKTAGTDNITATVISTSVGCYDSIASSAFTITASTTDISNVSLSQAYIYPNPATCVLHIDNITTGLGFSIMSIIGSVLQHGTLQQGNNSVSLQALPAGMYMLELTDENGRRTIKKIIKE